MIKLPENRFHPGTPLSERSDDIAQYLAAIVDSSDDAIFSLDLHGMITSWNKGAEQLFGYAFAEAVGKPITMLVPSDRQNEEPGIVERIGRGERVDHYETVRRCKDGSFLEISLTVSPVRNAKGQIIGASKIARDITRRKRREAQLTTLAREADHRSRNILSVLEAIVQLSQADTPEELKLVIAGRIGALSSVISLFAESRWVGAELHALLGQELSAYCSHGGPLSRLDGPNLILEPDTAQAIALVVHELATNAAKYGALSVAGARVDIEWSRMDDDRVVLRWTELGGPGVTAPKRKGFGSQLIEGMIRQLDGNVSLDWRAEGLACEMVFSNRRAA